MPETRKFNSLAPSKLSTIENVQRKQVPAKYFDQQLQFTDDDGTPLRNVKYDLCLEDGRTVQGKTDIFGKTQRVYTAVPMAIMSATLEPAGPVICSCRMPDAPAKKPERLELKLSSVKTTSTDVGTSVVPVKTPPGKSRKLTEGERIMCRRLFKDALDFDKVEINNKVFVKIQGSGVGMAPNGNVYFHPDDFLEDFAAPDVGANDLQFFMHEMVHVWQHQLGYPVGLMRAVHIAYLPYTYALVPGAKLQHYNMEQQGDLLSDYWALLTFGAYPPLMKNKKRPTIKQYEEVLSEFLRHPDGKFNLPLP